MERLHHARCCAHLPRSAIRSAADRVVVLENGYDEDSFAEAERLQPAPQPIHPGAITLLHSGIVYPDERDPSALFEALQRLAAQGHIDPKRLRLRFRAAVHDQLLHELAAQHGVADFVECLPAVPYRDALQEMRRADGLLVLQARVATSRFPPSCTSTCAPAGPCCA